MKLTKKEMLEEIFNGMNENQKARVIEALRAMKL